MVLFSSRAISGSPTEVLPGACLDGLRDAMKPLYQVLGFRSEYSRSDRNNYITFASSDINNLVTPILREANMFRVYPSNEASFFNAFDPWSITMVDGRRWAKSFYNPVFTPKDTVVIGGKANLSQQDCQALAVYGCDLLKCTNRT